MSSTDQLFVQSCLIPGGVALAVVIFQLAAYGSYVARLQRTSAESRPTPSGVLPGVLLLIMLVAVAAAVLIASFCNRSYDWWLANRQTLGLSAWLLIGIAVSAVALTLACRLLDKILGWPAPPLSRVCALAAISVPCVLAVVLLPLGACYAIWPRREWGPALISPVCALILLTALAAHVLGKSWRTAMVTTVLHVGFALLLTIAVWMGWRTLHRAVTPFRVPEPVPDVRQPL